jgi:SAM-dependent methyltransferase
MEATVTDHGEQLARVARGWDDAAEGYDGYFVPRFAPWTSEAVQAVAAAALPPGGILVPCCGTFPELDSLLAYFPDRDIVGIDLSAGMVRRARERAAPRSNVGVVVGDAATLDRRWSGQCAAVVSVFGLQQLSEPDAAVQSWLGTLVPGGKLCVMYWPDVTEEDGPFALMKRVVRGHTPAEDTSWEDRLADAVTATGAVLERDEYVSHWISHPDALAYFEAYSRHGPLRTLANARPEFVDQLREEFLDRAPAGEWHHRPRARLILARSVSEHTLHV